MANVYPPQRFNDPNPISLNIIPLHLGKWCSNQSMQQIHASNCKLLFADHLTLQTCCWHWENPNSTSSRNAVLVSNGPKRIRFQQLFLSVVECNGRCWCFAALTGRHGSSEFRMPNVCTLTWHDCANTSLWRKHKSLTHALPKQNRKFVIYLMTFVCSNFAVQCLQTFQA